MKTCLIDRLNRAAIFEESGKTKSLQINLIQFSLFKIDVTDSQTRTIDQQNLHFFKRRASLPYRIGKVRGKYE